MMNAFNAVAERTYYNTKDIQQKNYQRRLQVVDIDGVEYTRVGDGGSPAEFYISISNDMVNLERFQFKLIIQPFAMTSKTGTQSQTVSVNNTSLTVNNNNISPNPHTHTTVAHSHNVVAGITLVNTTASDFRIKVGGVDVTAYLMAQYDSWIDGEGIYPDETLNAYDILEVASDLQAEDNVTAVTRLLESGYKKVEITSDAPFQATMVLYLKYSHLNR